jgi:lysostaphin
MKLLLLLFIFFISLPSHSAIWMRPTSVKQGEIIVLTGLNYEFGNAYSMLGGCKLNFEGHDYPFHREIVSHSEFQSTNQNSGFQFIARVPTTPLTTTGTKKLTLNCPLGSQDFNITVLSGGFPVQDIKLTKGKSSLVATKTEQEAVQKAINTVSPYRLWDASKAWSVPNTARRSSGYGLQRSYNGVPAKNYFHKGLDFAAFTGNPILSPADGKVILTGKVTDGFVVHGNCIFIDHGQGVVSSYLHLSSIGVNEGDEVKAGQLIGKVGDTGIATGPHLHFGLYVNGQNVNPEPWFKFAMP